MNNYNIEQIITENARRIAQNNLPRNQITCEGCNACPRTKVQIKEYFNGAPVWLPNAFIQNSKIVAGICNCGSVLKYLKQNKLPSSQEDIAQVVDYYLCMQRFSYDFEFMCAVLLKIKIKLSPESRINKTAGKSMPFILNRGQTKVLKYVYQAIYSGVPIRIIICKCRQWGCSTLCEALIFWFQFFLFKSCNTVICAHTESAARNIRGIYHNFISNIESGIFAENKIKLLPFEGSTKTRYCPLRDFTVSIGSSQKPDGIRSEDITIAHLSEVAYYINSENTKPEALIQSINSSIPEEQETVCFYESTPNGVGNFFHNEYLDAKRSENGFIPVFVAWYEIDSYTKNIDDYPKFIRSLSQKEMQLFKKGATLEAINWYRTKSRQQKDKWRFISEFPSDDIEAFQSSGGRYFNIEDVEKLRNTCCNPQWTGDITADDNHTSKALNNIRFVQDTQGKLSVWEMPDELPQVTDRYVVVVDVSAGLSDDADNGVITVIDRYWQHTNGGIPEIVAEWVGHIPSHYLVWKAVQIATLYHNALLVVESNSVLSGNTTRGFEFDAAFDVIAQCYDNIYQRVPQEQIKKGVAPKWGFNTNRASKYMVCEFMKIVLDKQMYIEKSLSAVNEFDTFERKNNGSLGAVEGNHDDRLITRVIGIWICYQDMNVPVKIKTPKPVPKITQTPKRPISSMVADGMSRF